MKQVIRKQTHYSLLLMRDDREVRMLRVHTGILRFFLFLCFLLLACAAAGLAAGWHYWKKSDALTARYPMLERELVETKLKLEQLTNESVLWRNAKSSAPSLKNEEMGAPVPSQPAFIPPAPPTPDILAPLQTPATDNPPSPAENATTPESHARPAAENATLPVENGTVPDSNGTALSMTETANATGESPASPAGRSAPPIEISGFNARITDGQRLRLRYAIVSPTHKTLVGAISYQALLANGTIMPLESLSPGERFKITRMKVVEKQARLPERISTRAIKQIDLIIELEDDSRVVKSFPMP